MRLDPKSAESAANLGYADLKLGLVADARTEVDEALRLNPAQSLALQLQATLGRVK